LILNSLEPLFTPRSLAIVGVTENPEKLGHLLLKNLLDSGFLGELHAVCATGGEVLGRKTLPSLKEVKGEVDLVLLTVPNPETISALREAARLEPKVVVVLSSGFGETGLAGKKVEREIHALFHGTGTRVVGPNCRGVYDAHNRLNATLYREVPRNRGNISFVTQSGSYGALLFQEVRQRGLGISKFASIGNQIDLDHTDFLEALGMDDRTDVIGLFAEEIKGGARFVQVAAEISIKKPIVLFKGGRTAAGSKVAEAHTGSVSGSSEVFEAAARQAGILLARDTEHFFDTIAVFSAIARNLPANENVGVLAVSGGPTVTAADLCEELGLRLVPLEPSARKAVRALIPESGSDVNPVDMTPEIDPIHYGPCVDAVLGDKNVSGCVVIDVGVDRPELARAVVDGRAKTSKPVVAFLAGVPEVASTFVRAGIPIFPSPERAVRAYHALVSYRKMLEVQKRKGIIARPATLTPTKAPGKGKPKPLRPVALAAADAKALLAEAGLPVLHEAIVHGLKEAGVFVEEHGWPVALRVRGKKPTADGAIADIGSRKELERALHALRHKAGKAGLVLERHVQRIEGELRVVGWRDPVFGCALRVGLSGAFSEILRDVAIRVCPIRRTEAEGMLQELLGWPLLAHSLATARLEPVKVAEVLVKLSDLLVARADLAELVLDPVGLARGKVLVIGATGTVLR